MNKRPFVASILFTGLSCAGILTMFAQSQPIDEFGAPIHAEGRWTSYDPGKATQTEFSEIVPQVTEEGRRQLQLLPASLSNTEVGEPKPTRAVLRLR